MVGVFAVVGVIAEAYQPCRLRSRRGVGGIGGVAVGCVETVNPAVNIKSLRLNHADSLRMQSHTRPCVRIELPQKTQIRTTPKTVSDLPFSVSQMRQRSARGVAYPAHRICASGMETCGAYSVTRVVSGRQIYRAVERSPTDSRGYFADLRNRVQGSCAVDRGAIEVSARGVVCLLSPDDIQGSCVRVYRPVRCGGVLGENIQSAIVVRVGSYRERGCVICVVVELASDRPACHAACGIHEGSFVRPC